MSVGNTPAEMKTWKLLIFPVGGDRRATNDSYVVPFSSIVEVTNVRWPQPERIRIRFSDGIHGMRQFVFMPPIRLFPYISHPLEKELKATVHAARVHDGLRA